MGAHRYVECSAMTGEGMEELLETVGTEATRQAVVREHDSRLQESEDKRPFKKRRFG